MIDDWRLKTGGIPVLPSTCRATRTNAMLCGAPGLITRGANWRTAVPAAVCTKSVQGGSAADESRVSLALQGVSNGSRGFEIHRTKKMPGAIAGHLFLTLYF